MATRAQNFRNLMERSGPKKPKLVKHKPHPRLTHNDAPTAGERRSTYAIEETVGQPSRKSTRDSSNRMRTDNTLALTALAQLSAPSQRARRRRQG